VRAFSGGQPEGFPYAARLPDPVHFERCEAFLDRWRRDNVYRAAYVRLAEQLETRYNLDHWVRQMDFGDGLALGATFQNVERNLWEKARAAMAELTSEDEWHAWLTAHRARRPIPLQDDARSASSTSPACLPARIQQAERGGGVRTTIHQRCAGYAWRPPAFAVDQRAV
jgi:hypothetical protein